MAEAYVGEVRLFAATFVPDGWLACLGQELPINQYAALYSLIGINYGGDGVSKFNLPDLRGRVPAQVGQSQFGTVNVGTKSGDFPTPITAAGSVQITKVAQLPAHNHTATLTVSKDGGTSAAPLDGGYLGAVKPPSIGTPPNAYVATTTTGTSTLNAASVTTANTGSDKPEAIPVTVTTQVPVLMPPSLGMFYAICWQGIFPPRP
jgi:microcystin-dependent protein